MFVIRPPPAPREAAGLVVATESAFEVSVVVVDCGVTQSRLFDPKLLDIFLSFTRSLTLTISVQQWHGIAQHRGKVIYGYQFIGIFFLRQIDGTVMETLFSAFSCSSLIYLLYSSFTRCSSIIIIIGTLSLCCCTASRGMCYWQRGIHQIFIRLFRRFESENTKAHSQRWRLVKTMRLLCWIACRSLSQRFIDFSCIN